MDSFVRIVNKSTSPDISTITENELVDNLTVCQFIQETSLTKTNLELEAICELYTKENPWLTIELMKTACSHYISLLLNNSSFSSMKFETKRVFYSFCRKQGYQDKLISSIGSSLFYRHHETQLSQTLSSLRNQQSEYTLTNLLPSFESLHSHFVSFTLSSDLLLLQRDAHLILSRMSSTPDPNALHKYAIELNEQMRTDQHSFNSILVGFILTYIPAITIATVPLEKEVTIDSKKNSLRYFLWKLIESYFSHLKWDSNQGCFVVSEGIQTNLFLVHPFILYLCSVLNYDFMQAIMPFFSQLTLYRFEMYHGIQDAFLCVLWGAFLRFFLQPSQQEFIRLTLVSIRDKLSPDVADSFSRYFNCII